MRQLPFFYEQGTEVLYPVGKPMTAIAGERNLEHCWTLERDDAGTLYVVYQNLTAGTILCRIVTITGIAYIAGPMRGLPDFNFPAFDSAHERLHAIGYYCFNPADMDRLAGVSAENPPKIADCMRRDLTAITYCTHIALLPGWEESHGVRPEAVLAKTLSLTFIDTDGCPLNSTSVCAVIGARMIGDHQQAVRQATTVAVHNNPFYPST